MVKRHAWKGLPPAIAKALNRFENAVREDEMKGAQEPDAADAIEEEYAKARELLHSTLSRAFGS